jgi:hypothetical protein
VVPEVVKEEQDVVADVVAEDVEEDAVEDVEGVDDMLGI